MNGNAHIVLKLLYLALHLQYSIIHMRHLATDFDDVSVYTAYVVFDTLRTIRNVVDLGVNSSQHFVDRVR